MPNPDPQPDASIPVACADRDDQIASRIKAAEHAKYAVSGCSWGLAAFCLMVMFFVLYDGHRRLGACLFVGLIQLQSLAFTIIQLGICRWMGLTWPEEIGFGVGPAVAWYRRDKVLLRFNLLPFGAYLSYPAEDAQGKPTGPLTLSPVRQMIIYIVPNTICILTGILLCHLSGDQELQSNALRWLSSPELATWHYWRISFTRFLANLDWNQSLLPALAVILITLGGWSLLSHFSQITSLVTSRYLPKRIGASVSSWCAILTAISQIVLLLGLSALLISAIFGKYPSPP